MASFPPYTHSEGPAAVQLCASVGFDLDPWQQFCLEVALAERRPGRWAAFEVALMVARQNGKGGVLEARELAGVLLFGERLIVHTAHLLETAETAHQRMIDLIDGSPALQKRAKPPVHTNGRKAIVWRNGARINYRARSGKAGRGLTGDMVVLDEAMYVDSSMLGALMPLMTARRNPQLWYAMSGLMPESTHARSLRQRALEAGEPDPHLAYLEFSAPEGSRLDDRAAWRAANPAMEVGRVTEEFLEKELTSLPEDEFAREVLCISEGPAGAAVIEEVAWDGCRDRFSGAGDQLVFALDVSPEREHASVGVAGLRPDGRWHLEVTHRATGTAWVVPWLAKRKATIRKVLLNPSGGAGALIPDLTKARIQFDAVTPREYGQACGFLVDAVDGGRVRHIDQVSLNTAVAAGRRRFTTDAWVWSRKTSTDDITPLVAVTLALFGHAQAVAAKPKARSAPLDPTAHTAAGDRSLASQMRW